MAALSRPGLEVVDWPVGDIDQPEPISLQAAQHRRLGREINVRVVTVEGLGDPAIQGSIRSLGP